MGECSDWSVGEIVDVFLVAHSEGGKISIPIGCPVKYVWEDAIDVLVSDVVLRFDRRAFDCSALEHGGRPSVNGDSFREHIGLAYYDPGEEASGG